MAPRRRSAVIAALIVGLLVLVGGGVAWMQWPSEYRATSTLVVLPAGEEAESADFYDILSQGQIVTTLAQIIDLQGSPAVTSGEIDADVSVDVVPDTSLIRVTATAADARSAEQAADSVLRGAQPYFEEVVDPYGVRVVQAAEGTAARTGLPLSALAVVVVTVAVVAGVSAYVAVRTIQRARRQTHPSSGYRRPAPAAGATGPAVSREPVQQSMPAQSNGTAHARPVATSAAGIATGTSYGTTDGPTTNPGLAGSPAARPAPPQPGR